MGLLTRIVQDNLSEAHYYREESRKSQIYLHHTAGGSNPHAVIDDWRKDSRGRIATCIVIGNGKFDGQIVQTFTSKYWAYHLGVKNTVFNAHRLPALNLDKTSIGIELCNWGPLTKTGSSYFNYLKKEVPLSEVCELVTPYKGYKYYHKYTAAQITAVRELLLYWGGLYRIPLNYNADIWGVTRRALTGTPGVFTHNSVRADKTDVSPQAGLISMLNSL